MDLRLVEQAQPVVGDGVAQRGGQDQPVTGLLVHARAEEAAVPAAIRLGLEHGGLGIFQQGVPVLAIFGVDGHAQACGQADRNGADMGGLAQHAQDRGAQRGGMLLFAIGDDGELVPPAAHQRVVNGQHVTQLAGDVSDQFIARRVAKYIIDMLEVIHPHGQQHQVAAHVAAQDAGHVLAQPAAVGQAGQQVEIRQAVDVFLRLVPFNGQRAQVQAGGHCLLACRVGQRVGA